MRLVKTGDIDFYYITDALNLNLMVSEWCNQKVLACDTETYIDLDKFEANALDAHSSKISLIQINYIDNNIPWLIDVIKIGVNACMEFINKIMMNENIIKVFHNARFDIKQFKSTFDVWIKNIVCTMVLVKSLGRFIICPV